MSAAGLWVLLALTSASLEPILAKLGFRGPLQPVQLLFLKNLFAALVILPVTRNWRWIGWSQIRLVASVSLLLMVTNAASLVAVKELPAVTVITLSTTTPAFVGLVNQWLGRERLGIKFWAGFGLCFLGILLSIEAFDQELRTSGWGLLAVGVSIVSSTVYRTRMEVVTKQIPPILVSTYIFLINGSISLLALWPWIDPIPTSAYPIGLWVGVAAAVANVAFLYALALVGSTNMSIFNLLQRPLIIVAAALILHEPMSWPQWIGVICVLVGIRLAQVRRKVESTPTESARVS